jgi:hypothetical protein
MVVHSCSHCYSGSVKNVVCVSLMIRVTVNNATLLSVAQKILLWQIHMAGDNRMYLGNRVKCPTFFPTLTKFFSFWECFYIIRNIKFHGNPSGESRADTCERTDGRTERRTEGPDKTITRFSLLCERVA